MYFSFDGIYSDEEFDVINISISTGMFSEPFLTNRSITEVTTPGNEKPYFFGVTRDPKSIQLGFYPRKDWDEEYMNRLARWLDVDDYAPLVFSGMPDRVMYAMPVDASEAIHNGCRQGYITLTMRLDSPYSYSHDKFQYYDLSDSEVSEIEFTNFGDKTIQPHVTIEKVDDGDIVISNVYAKAEPLIVTDLLDGEKIEIDPDLPSIESNLPNVWRYDNFNENYITLPYGNSVFKVEGKCRIQFQFRYKFII